MQIHLAQSAGFCFGVRRAIRIAGELAAQRQGVVMLGDLVHNETVVAELRQAGIRKIKRLDAARGRTLLIRAHGAGRETIAQARRKGFTIVDATCPMVQEIHRIVRRMERQGRRIIIIGDSRHDEVLGIAGQLKQKAIVIDNTHPINPRALQKLGKSAVVIQSTQNLANALLTVARLQKLLPDLRVFNTICKPTRMKQAEINKMPARYDVMLIIGSGTSANTQRLYEIARRLNPRSYRINAPEEIDPHWFKKARSVGITAGASTPETTIQAVIRHIRAITRTRGCSAERAHKTSANCGLSLRKTSRPTSQAAAVKSQK